MCAEFSSYRIDPVIQMMEKKLEKGRILGFVRGLRLSAQLIYAIRDVLSGSPLCADWGHLVDKERNLCSPECDIIIYDGTFVARWNKNSKPVMDFYFIERSHAVAVISCKSFLDRVDKEYVQTVGHFIKNVWLFAECCPTGRTIALKEAARKAGYKGLFYLYPWDKKGGVKPDHKEWKGFVDAIQTLRQNGKGASK
jgi:hypothetical protein